MDSNENKPRNGQCYAKKKRKIPIWHLLLSQSTDIVRSGLPPQAHSVLLPLSKLSKAHPAAAIRRRNSSVSLFRLLYRFVELSRDSQRRILSVCVEHFNSVLRCPEHWLVIFALGILFVQAGHQGRAHETITKSFVNCKVVPSTHERVSFLSPLEEPSKQRK